MSGRCRRLLAGAAAAPLVLFATACGTAATTASEPASTPPAAQTADTQTSPSQTAPAQTAPAQAPPASVADAATSPASSASGRPPAPGATTTAGLTGCAAQAAHTYFHALSARHSASGGLVLTGHMAMMICGGPDDWHFVDGSATVTARVLPSAHVEVVEMIGGGASDTAIPVGTLTSALARDQSTRTFLVSGPITAITGLSEIWHP
jgi:hypothetical protein